ncbi:unnamed protein product [Adineta ricciae]|uniref:Uncharacterized protein n=1 Tax=Adineta ricciae TaxID=249248 RepID=A0A814TC02_ADIRI|nr:unnamed protein product [Adineta ricciae]CAF1159408.1 unnamed protein product [Adineta ricciae]
MHDSNVCNFVTLTNLVLSKKSIALSEILNQKRSTPVEKPVSIVRVNVQYQRQDGKWIDCLNAKITKASTQSDNKPKLGSTILNADPDRVVAASVETTILVKGKPNRTDATRTCAHRSLPLTLKLRIIFVDNLTKTCSLIVEQINEPFDSIMKEALRDKRKDSMKRLIAFMSADDCEYDGRTFTAIYISNNDLLLIDDGMKNIYIEKSHIHTMKWKAKKNKITEESTNYVGDSQIQLFSMFDAETYLFYAVRIELATIILQTIETVLLPLNEIK